MSNISISQEEFNKLQNDIKNLKIENERLSAAILLLEQLVCGFADDLDPQNRISLIKNIDDNFHELGQADTIPLSPTPSLSSNALKVALKLRELGSVYEMLLHKPR